MPITRPSCSWNVLIVGLVVGLGLGALVGFGQVGAAQQGVQHMAAKSSTVYDFTLNDIDGKPVSLSQFKGKVIMLVNTASFCGNTPQYTDLETMYETYKDKGFEVLAFESDFYGLTTGWEKYSNGMLTMDALYRNIFSIWTHCDAARQQYDPDRIRFPALCRHPWSGRRSARCQPADRPR